MSPLDRALPENHPSPPRQPDAHRLEAILASIGDHLVTYDHAWRFTYINEGGARMLGATVESLIGRCIWDVFPQAVGNEYHRALHEAVATKRAIRQEHYYAPWDRWFENHIYPMSDGVTVFASDITARKHTERLLEQSRQELEARVEARTRELRDKVADLETFSYSMSHDLRAPLRALGGYARALLEDYGPQLDATAQGYLRRIEAAGVRLDRLIRDVLAYGRVGREELKLGRVEVSSLISDVIAQRADAGATFRFVPEIVWALAHEPLLHQCISNLVDNAVKFVAPGVPPVVEITVQRTAGRVRVAVRDNGIGIAPEHHRRIFGLFERLHAEAIYPGTGLGLAIASRAIDRMSGTIGVESEAGKGTVIWLELPAAS
jgi:PAS domain S-box-containing protein